MRRFWAAMSLAVIAGPVSGQEAEYPQFRLMGFGDVSYAYHENETDGFFVGQAVGQFTALLNERVTVFGETSLTGNASGYGIEMERLIMRYDFADYLKVSAGRYHSPISYWNTAFHHGLWLQTSVGRPEMIRFGSRLIPVHFVGLQVEGTLAPATTALTYSFGVGNGRAANVARAGDNGDINGDRALVMSVASRPPALVGLEVGAGLYIDRIGADDGEADLRERIGSVHVALVRTSLELIAEYAAIWHALDDPGADFERTSAWYAQAGYRLAGAANALKPYIRYEKIDPAAADAFVTGLGLDYRAAVVGVRYDFAPLAALKAEYRNIQFDDASGSGSLVIQASFALSRIGGSTME